VLESTDQVGGRSVAAYFYTGIGNPLLQILIEEAESNGDNPLDFYTLTDFSSLNYYDKDGMVRATLDAALLPDFVRFASEYSVSQSSAYKTHFSYLAVSYWTLPLPKGSLMLPMNAGKNRRACFLMAMVKTSPCANRWKNAGGTILESGLWRRLSSGSIMTLM
jgi:hypothetical protein